MTWRPSVLLERPRRQPVDVLSDVLRAVRLTGAVFFDVAATDPWVAESPPGETIVGTIFPGAGHLISYHVVTEGRCWGTIVGNEPMPLSAGDIFVLPHSHAHVMSSAPGMRGKPNPSLYRPPRDGQLPFTMTMGAGAGEPARIVCGFLGCDASPFNPLLSSLPSVIRVSDQGTGAISTFVQFAIAESKAPRPGGECVLGRLSELMFVDVVRQYLELSLAERSGWLAGLHEPFVGRALAALHRDPARPWTIDSLAREVGLSRSALAERFAALVGQPPMQYLTSWRMQLAATHLLSGSDNVAAIAERVGYESEAAFSRAFKKAAGVAPSLWRNRQGSSGRASRTNSDDKPASTS
jgi:AraC-like DNA-binding protein